MKVATLRFRDAAVKRAYRDAWTERMLLAGYSSHDAFVDWEIACPPKALQAMFSGTDAVERAVDVANEVKGTPGTRGIMVKIGDV